MCSCQCYVPHLCSKPLGIQTDEVLGSLLGTLLSQGCCTCSTLISGKNIPGSLCGCLSWGLCSKVTFLVRSSQPSSLKLQPLTSPFSVPPCFIFPQRLSPQTHVLLIIYLLSASCSRRTESFFNPVHWCICRA